MLIHEIPNKKNIFSKKRNPEMVMGIPITILEKIFFKLSKKMCKS
jgi:hypothetical protein